MEDFNIFLGRLRHENITDEKITQTFCNDIFSTTDRLSLNNEILYKCVGKEILTGNEGWYYSKEKGTYYYNQFNKADDVANNLKMLCNYFIFSNSKVLKWGQFQSGINKEIHFKFDKEEKEDINQFKSWLNNKYKEGHPVEVYFVMQYPNILCKRYTYHSNPRLANSDREDYNFESENGSITPTISYEKNLFYETDNIYMRKIK